MSPIGSAGVVDTLPTTVTGSAFNEFLREELFDPGRLFKVSLPSTAAVCGLLLASPPLAPAPSTFDAANSAALMAFSTRRFAR